jgi:hypothetical protein
VSTGTGNAAASSRCQRDEEAAGRRDSRAPVRRERAARRDEARQQRIVGPMDDGIDGRPVDPGVAHRERKRFRRADIAGDARELGGEREDAEQIYGVRE